ncbi:cytochrome c [Spongiivirga sp. MCCC 1A20706]|uniref:c-type cytochrome n=1 Tax=Spongiivirga sp. MCCC 1A20706 TaxID=3160963 RepID=UPI0039774B87
MIRKEASFFILLIGLTLFNSCRTSDRDRSISYGKSIYNNKCASCHLENGEGSYGAVPPLANSDYFKNDLLKGIKAIKFGLEGKIVVNGVTYNNKKKPSNLTDQEVADVLNYILNSWGSTNEKTLTEADISKVVK